MIEFFDTLEDMFAAEEANQKAASKMVKDWQRELKPGDCFIRSACGVVIYSEVIESEYAEDAEMYADGDYRFCRAYSRHCPHGEYGDVHISTAVKVITREEFDGVVTDLQG